MALPDCSCLKSRESPRFRLPNRVGSVGHPILGFRRLTLRPKLRHTDCSTTGDHCFETWSDCRRFTDLSRLGLRLSCPVSKCISMQHTNFDSELLIPSLEPQTLKPDLSLVKWQLQDCNVAKLHVDDTRLAGRIQSP